MLSHLLPEEGCRGFFTFFLALFGRYKEKREETSQPKRYEGAGAQGHEDKGHEGAARLRDTRKGERGKFTASTASR